VKNCTKCCSCRKRKLGPLTTYIQLVRVMWGNFFATQESISLCGDVSWRWNRTFAILGMQTEFNQIHQFCKGEKVQFIRSNRESSVSPDLKSLTGKEENFCVPTERILGLVVYVDFFYTSSLLRCLFKEARLADLGCPHASFMHGSHAIRFCTGIQSLSLLLRNNIVYLNTHTHTHTSNSEGY